jgi:hypothetical protein
MLAEQVKKPGKREGRRSKGEFTKFKEQQRARGMFFDAGISQGRTGRVLTYYVDKQMNLATA